MAPACCNNSSGAVWVARAASTTALYSGAFLSGLNRILYSCSLMGSGQVPAPRSVAHWVIWAATSFFFSMAARAWAMTSADALRKRPLPARRK